MKHTVELEKISTVTLETTLPHKEIVLNRTGVEKRIVALQKLQEQQKNNVPVLVNIAVLKRSIYNQKDAYIYWEEARKIDPNNALFK